MATNTTPEADPRTPATRLDILIVAPSIDATEDAWNEVLAKQSLSIVDGILQGEQCGTVPESESGGQVQVDVIENEDDFDSCFSPPFANLSEALIDQIQEAPSGIALHFPTDLRDKKARLQVVDIVKKIHLACGSLALRVEQAKLGWETQTWLDAISSDDPQAWHRTLVTYITLNKNSGVKSCGMHVFSLPDVQVQSKLVSEARALANALNLYQVSEFPSLLSGQTFAPNTTAPVKYLQRWPDTMYEAGHTCHNPFGSWLLVDKPLVQRPNPDTTLVFISSLVAIITAAQKASKKPLKKSQIEKIRDAASTMVVTPRDAQVLERSRGYADVTPELAYEQWKIIATWGEP